MSERSGSRLFYYGTQDEVQLGDRIRIKRWLRRDLYGVVCYIPGISPRHRELERKGDAQWAVRLDDGTILAAGYFPEHRYGQPKKDMILLERGGTGELTPDERLL